MGQLAHEHGPTDVALLSFAHKLGLVREAVADGCELGRRVQEILVPGALVDDETMAAVVRHRLSEEDAAHGFLLDGYPRNHDQAETLSEILEELGTELDLVWFVAVPKSISSEPRI